MISLEMLGMASLFQAAWQQQGNSRAKQHGDNEATTAYWAPVLSNVRGLETESPHQTVDGSAALGPSKEVFPGISKQSPAVAIFFI